MVYQIEGALASALAAREALVAQHGGFILATNELDERALSLYLKKPERIMALLQLLGQPYKAFYS